MAKADAAAYAAGLALYEKVVATIPGVERKGDTMPYTSVNGHMFSLYTKQGTLTLRLPPEAREAFLKKYRTKLSVQYGVVMKEYVEVPAALLSRTAELKKFFTMSYEYAGALKAKPTTRGKAASKR